MLPSKTGEGQIILGESTELKFLEEKWPVEKRYSVVKAVEVENFWTDVDLEKGHSPFHRFKNRQVMEYPNLQAPLDQIVVSNDAYGYETPGANWLALNPVIGQELGWKLNPDGWFQWICDSGNIVAKSIWWRDGYIEQYNRHARIEVGEGWLVVVLRSGFDEIKNLYTTLNRGCVARRSMGWLGRDGSKISKQIIPLE